MEGDGQLETWEGLMALLPYMDYLERELNRRSFQGVQDSITWLESSFCLFCIVGCWERF